MSFSPAVGLFGHRQVGKTKLAEQLGSRYFTLDLASTLDRVNQDPLRFLDENPGRPLVIDECQRSPALFPALKERIRAHPRPGQYLLTGSVRFTSRKSIRESLTGRIINWELLPMDWAEAKSLPLVDAIPRLLSSRTVELDFAPAKPIGAEVDGYLERGGLPGVFAVRDPAVRAQRFETQIETALDRDLRLVSETTLPFGAIRRVLAYIANRQGHPFEFSEAMRATRISVPTLKKLIAAFESMFLIRTVLAEGGEKRPVIFFEDQGEATHLQSAPLTELEDFERFLYANLRTQWYYRPELGARLTQYRTRGGAYVPFVLRSKTAALGMLPILEENPGPQPIGSATSFLKKNPGSKIIFVHPGKKDWILGRDMRVIGAGALLIPS